MTVESHQGHLYIVFWLDAWHTLSFDSMHVEPLGTVLVKLAQLQL